MPAVESFTMTYDALNERGTFSEGDAITGKVALVLSKETAIQSLFVKLTGDAEVRWTQKSGDHTHTYSAHQRYFKLKQFSIEETSKGTAVPRGRHVYPFAFQIPTASMPSSFKGSYGKIVYKLEAKLARSWRMDRTVDREIQFASKAFHHHQSWMSQQAASTQKDMGLFSKGSVRMDVVTDRAGYAPGETMVVVAKINNSSSKNMTPKFSLIRDLVYHANGGHTKHDGTTVAKVADQCVKPNTQREVSCKMQIPRDLIQTIQNCEIITLKYYVKVYLDISFSFDPEIIIPVVIFHPDFTPGPHSGAAWSPHPAGARGGPTNSDFRPPAVAMGGPSNSDFRPPAMGPYPAYPAYPPSPLSGRPGYPGAQSNSAPPAYAGPPGVYPAAPPAGMSGGYNNPAPQQPSPYGSPFSSSSSSLLLHPPPTAPTLQPSPFEIQPPPSSQPFNISPTAPTYNLQPSAPAMNTDFLSQSDEAPPAYSVLFPSSATENSDAK